MPTSNLNLQNITSLRQQRDQTDQQVYSGALQLQKLQAQLTKAQQMNPQQVAALRQQVDQAQQGLAGSRTTLATAKQQLQTAIQGLYQQEGPQQLTGSWSDALPIALFPVRIETRFQTGGGAGRSVQQPELWVRIYPDEIVIDNFEKTLTDAEVAAGTSLLDHPLQCHQVRRGRCGGFKEGRLGQYGQVLWFRAGGLGGDTD